MEYTIGIESWDGTRAYVQYAIGRDNARDETHRIASEEAEHHDIHPEKYRPRRVVAENENRNVCFSKSV